MDLTENLKEKIKNLPENSGVYIMRDETGNIIYIGKAVVLKNRVRQYFQNSPKQVKVQAMVDNIADFEYIITLTEKDALALESNLIKKYKPKYNILLKDDKSSPYIKIDLKQEFPTIEVTRKFRRDGARYFGPYFNGISVWDVVSIIRGAYQMRTCPKALKKNRRECLNYHIKLCLAPCCGHVTHDEYMQVVNKVIAFLTGREDSAERLITQKMNDAVEREEFERAITYRRQLETLTRLHERTVANLGAVTDVDAFAYATNGEYSTISVCLVRGGKMLGVRNYTITDASLSAGDALTGFITQYYGGNNELPAEICLPVEFDTGALKEYLSTLTKSGLDILFPKQGARKILLKTAEENAHDYLIKSADKKKRAEDMTVRASKRLAEILGIPSARRMECYDISNISGTDKVASQVVFIDGAASKSDYRRYRIKTVEGSNDFASMAEVIRRRIERAQAGDDKFSELPDLIVVDGGKGQLSSAREAMLACGADIPMIGLAKREEEVFTPFSSDPILLPKDSYVLRMLQRIRDEAHRFAITYHRNLRSKRLGSELEHIPGIGPAKRVKILKAYPNFKDITTATADELVTRAGIDRRAAESVAKYFVEKAAEANN